MNNNKYLNSIAKCPRCHHRLSGNLKVTAIGEALSFKTPTQYFCIKCGQRFESHPHPLRQILLFLTISLAVFISILFISILIGEFIHSMEVLAPYLAIVGSSLLWFLVPFYKPKTNPNQSSEPT